MLAVALLACGEGYRAPTNCSSWRYGAADEPAAGVLPAEYDRNAYELTSLRDTSNGLGSSIQNQCGQKGAAVDLAWRLTQGRDDVRIAVLDSGIEWRNADAMKDLATAAYVNLGEAKPPCIASVPSGDCNGDGQFDITDFGPIADLNGNGLADPEDLILSPTHSNGVDDDHDGYVDDISGWDFLYGDNDALDTVNYGHGTGEARDSTAASNGAGSVGTCPNCRFVPVRVGDSFIADGGRFAAGVLFALDSGVDVVQEALGAISNPRQAQQAIDAAYERGVVVVASMADEASEHPNLPGSLEHTMAVNSITTRGDPVANTVDGYLALNGCTNFGGHVWVSVPSSSCSSEATGLGAGMVGLLESAAREAGIAPYPGLGGAGGNVLSANEAMQVVQANADDVDFSTPSGSDPANDYGLPKTAGVIENSRYPTRKGWDYVNGFGRINAYEIVRTVKAGLIPPEADITSPEWFDVLPATGTVPVTGSISARFAAAYDWRVEWTTGANPPAYPATDTWHAIGGQTDRATPINGTLATLDLAAVAAALPAGGQGASVGDDGKPDGDRFAVRVRIVATAKDGKTKGLKGISQKQVFVHADPELATGFPKRVPGASASSPVFANLGSPAGDEMVLATSDGDVHAYTSTGAELPGWPVHTAVAPWWPAGSPTAAAEGITAVRSAVLVGAPAITDVNGDGKLDVVVADNDGNVWAWSSSGARLPGFGLVTVGGRQQSQVHVNPAFSTDSPGAQDEVNRTQPSFVGSVAIGNLDDDAQPELVVASLDRHVYAFNHDGTTLRGFPVLLADPDKVSAVDPTTNHVSFVAGSGIVQSGGMVATPTLYDFTGDGKAEIVIGAQESYVETPDVVGPFSIESLLPVLGTGGNARLYMVSPLGTTATNPDRNAAHPDDRAYVPGWPTKLAQLQMNVLPLLGDGVATQAAVADLTSNPGVDIIAQSAGGPTYVLKPDGTSSYGSLNGKKNTAVWAGGLLNEGNFRFGANRNSSDIIISAAAFSGPAVGKLDSDGIPEFATPTAGLTRLADLALDDLQPPSDDQLMAYKPGDGSALPGFPQVTSDLAFFVTPAIADVDGNGKNEVIAANGVYTINAFEADGRRPAGWGKLTGGWVVGTPALGDMDGDGKYELAVVRRDGVLLVWHTNQNATGAEWPRFGGNARNTGVYKG